MTVLKKFRIACVKTVFVFAGFQVLDFELKKKLIVFSTYLFWTIRKTVQIDLKSNIFYFYFKCKTFNTYNFHFYFYTTGPYEAQEIKYQNNLVNYYKKLPTTLIRLYLFSSKMLCLYRSHVPNIFRQTLLIFIARIHIF